MQSFCPAVRTGDARIMKLNRMWLLFAILSAVFAAATAILAKIGIESVDSNLATAIRTIVIVIMAWVVVIVSHRLGHQSERQPGRQAHHRTDPERQSP